MLIIEPPSKSPISEHPKENRGILYDHLNQWDSTIRSLNWVIKNKCNNPSGTHLRKKFQVQELQLP